jgi:oligoribonuclease
MSLKNPIVWIDLEMSGLDPDSDRILEIACIVTDANLSQQVEGPEIVIGQSDEVLDGMDSWNRQHHGASGLTERVRGSRVTEGAAEQRIIEFISKHCAEGEAPLAGNSIHQDRRFLARYMKRLEQYLHYRIIDVSSVKELVYRWCPEAFEQRPRKNSTHRALDDIRESIEELRFYRDRFFREHN